MDFKSLIDTLKRVVEGSQSQTDEKPTNGKEIEINAEDGSEDGEADEEESESETEEEVEEVSEDEEVSENEDETSASVDTVEGIGASYSERLGDAGVETVADLADAEPEELAEETDISESRLERWVGRAKDAV